MLRKEMLSSKKRVNKKTDWSEYLIVNKDLNYKNAWWGISHHIYKISCVPKPGAELAGSCYQCQLTTQNPINHEGSTPVYAMPETP
jgi:hypothetical protein